MKVNPLKINLIIPSFYPAIVYGGPIFSTLYTCKALVQLNGIEIWVSTTNTNMRSKLDVKTNKWQKFQDNFFVKYYNETIIDIFSISLYVNIWKDIKSANIIHIQGIFNTPTPIALVIAYFFQKPVLLSPRGALGEWCLNSGNRFKQKWLKWFIKPFASKIIWHATADQEKNDILAIFPEAKVKTISNGIEYTIFQKSSSLSKHEYIKK